jgi:CPA2 family monovalent cation:H+ antiporter-2
VLLGGVTYISSSGIIAKVLDELGRLNNYETKKIISILVFEDLVMAVYLPLVAVLLIAQGFAQAVFSILIALATVGSVLFIALRYGKKISQGIAHQSDEVILFTTFGLVLLVAGISQRLQVSAAIGAFLVGIALSDPIAERTHRLLGPSRDLFAGIFFLFFGLQIDPASLPPVLLLAIILGLITALTKLLTGWWSARRAKSDSMGAFRAGSALVARGEFSIVIAGLGVSAGLEPQLGALSAAYVLLMAILGPVLARVIEPLATLIIPQKEPEQR